MTCSDVPDRRVVGCVLWFGFGIPTPTTTTTTTPPPPPKDRTRHQFAFPHPHTVLLCTPSHAPGRWEKNSPHPTPFPTPSPRLPPPYCLPAPFPGWNPQHSGGPGFPSPTTSPTACHPNFLCGVWFMWWMDVCSHMHTTLPLSACFLVCMYAVVVNRQLVGGWVVVCGPVVWCVW